MSYSLNNFSYWWLRVFLVKFLSGECYWTLLTIHHHCFRGWLGADRQGLPRSMSEYGQKITIYNAYSQPIHIWYKWYWHNYHSEQYNISNKIHINPARSQPYPNPKYISFNNGFRGDNSGMLKTLMSRKWRHNDRDDFSNHRRLDCLLNRLFRHRSKKTSKFRVTGLCEGNSPVTGEFPTKGPVKRKMFPFDDIIMDLASFV